MKKKRLLRSILLLLSFVLGVLAFVVSFNAGVISSGIVESETTGILLGTVKTTIGSVTAEVPKDAVVRAGTSLLGIIMVLVGSICTLISCFARKRSRLIVFLGFVLILAGAIMVLFLKNSYAVSSVKHTLKKTSVEVSEEAKADMIEVLKESIKLNGAAVLTGILAILSSITTFMAMVIRRK